MAMGLEAWKSHGTPRILAMAALFGILGPAMAVLPLWIVGGLPLIVMALIDTIRTDAGFDFDFASTLEALYQIYQIGGTVALICGLALPFLFEKGYQNTLPRAWLASLIGMGGLGVVASIGAHDGSAMLTMEGIFPSIVGLAMMFLIFALPASTLCWMVGRRLGLV